MKIFTGHCGAITCLDLHGKKFVSGGTDGMVKGESQNQELCSQGNGRVPGELWCDIYGDSLKTSV